MVFPPTLLGYFSSLLSQGWTLRPCRTRTVTLSSHQDGGVRLNTCKVVAGVCNKGVHSDSSVSREGFVEPVRISSAFVFVLSPPRLYLPTNPFFFFLADMKTRSTSARQRRMSLWCSRRCVPGV